MEGAGVTSTMPANHERRQTAGRTDANREKRPPSIVTPHSGMTPDTTKVRGFRPNVSQTRCRTLTEVEEF
jgi:hypothetical protein